MARRRSLSRKRQNTVLQMEFAPANASRRDDAVRWDEFGRKNIAKMRDLCEQIVAILEAHPDSPKPLGRIPICEEDVSETISSLESLHFDDDDSDIPRTPSFRRSTTALAQSSPKDKAVRMISNLIKAKYRKMCEKLKNRHKFDFPREEDHVNTMMYKIGRVEFAVRVLEKQCDALVEQYGDPKTLTGDLRRSTKTLVRIYDVIQSYYDTMLDCKSQVNMEMEESQNHMALKKYVRDKLAEWKRAREEDPKSDSPVARPSGFQNRPTAKTTKDVSSKTPQKRSTRVSASASDDPHTPTSSQRTPKHSAKEDPHGQPPSKRTPKHSDKDSRGKRLGIGTSGVKSVLGSEYQPLSRKNRNDKNVNSSGDSSEETSRDTISGQVYDSVADMALTGSEDDDIKKAQSESPTKTGTKPKIASAKKDRTELKDSPKTRSQSRSKSGAKTRSPSMSKRDSKTGAKQKKFFTTPTKSKKGYKRVPQSDSDED